MRIPLLTHTIPAPNRCEGADDGRWIRPLVLGQFLNEGRISALVARLAFLALRLMLFREAQGVERQCMGQALHHRVKKAGVAQIVHRERYSASWNDDRIRCLR